jgi:hypothetical protein
MTREEAQREFEELMRTPIGPAKPKVDVVSVQVDRPFAKQVRENPEDVMVWVRSADGVSLVQKPLRVWHQEMEERGVNAQGQPIWEKAGARHEYNPLDALKGKD